MEFDPIDAIKEDARINGTAKIEEEASIPIAFGLIEKNGRYQRFKANSDGTSTPVDLTNFIMKGLYLIKGRQPTRIIHFKAASGESETVAIPIEQLTSDGVGKIVKGIGNLSAKWSKNQFEDILLHACKDQGKAKTCEYLGHHEDGQAFVFGNGVIRYDDNRFYPVNEHGIAELPDSRCYHIPQYKNEGETMNYKPGEINFRDYFDLMSNAYGKNGRTGAAVVLAYAFSDILFRETGNIFLLFLAGKRETGKTSFADCIRAPFYFKKPATVNLKSSSTVKSRYRMLAKYSNGVVVFDEFTDITTNTNLVVTAYNRDGYSRAATSNDNETLETPVRSNSLFIGNYLPESEPAAMSRLIILPFRKDDKHQYSLQAYRQLTNLLRKGTGDLLRQILTQRRNMEAKYSASFADYMQREELTKHVQDIRDCEKVAAIMATLEICGPPLGVTEDEIKDIAEFLEAQLRDQKALVDDTDHANQFFAEIAILIYNGTLIDGKHFALSTDLTEVIIKLGSCYAEAQQSAVKQRRTLVGKSMLKRLLMEHDGFVSGTKSSNYRIRRNGLLGLGFKLESLPDDLREVLVNDPIEVDDLVPGLHPDDPELWQN